MANIGDVTVVLRTNTQRFTAGMAQARTSLGQAETTFMRLGRTMQGQERLFNKLERALGGAAFAAAGVPGPFGRIASTLLQFGTGGAVTLGVIAGVGLIGLAFNKLTENARKAREELQKTRDTAAGFRSTPGGEAALNLGKINAEIGRLEEQLARARELSAFPKFREKALDLENQIAKLQIDAATFRAQMDQAHLDALAKAMTSEDRINQLLFDRWDAMRRLTMTITALPALSNTSGLQPFLPATSQAGGLAVRHATGEGSIERELGRAMARNDKAMAEIRERLSKDFSELSKEVGIIFARGFTRSALDGFKGFKQTLKNILSTLIEEAVTAGIRAGFKKPEGGGPSFFQKLLGFGTSVAVGVATSGVSNLIKGGASAGAGSIVGDSLPFAAPVVIQGPPTAPTNPLAASRDAEWMAYLSESIRHLRSAGARV